MSLSNDEMLEREATPLSTSDRPVRLQRVKALDPRRLGTAYGTARPCRMTSQAGSILRNRSPGTGHSSSMCLEEQVCAQANRKQAKLMRRTALALSMADDRALFIQKAEMLDRQAVDLERLEASNRTTAAIVTEGQDVSLCDCVCRDAAC
jgi:hypothetical protein